MTTSRRNSRARRSNRSLSSAPFTPAKQSRRRSPIASGDAPPQFFINKDRTMNPEFRAAILQALQLTRSQNVMEATRVIQRALAGRSPAAPPVDEPRERAPALPPPPEVTRTADAVRPPPQPFLNTDSTMKTDFSAAMRQALQLTRAQNVQNVMEATRVIQRALAGRSPAAPPVDEPWERAPALPPPPEVTRTADAVEPPPQPFLNTDSTMKTDFSAAMRQALQLTRAQNVQNVMEATRVIQRALAGRS